MGCILKIHIKTLSNLFIGGAPKSFEIGGIDQWTAADEDGFPCIPASSLKGALRAIVSRDTSEKAAEITEWYREYLRRQKESVCAREISLDKQTKKEVMEHFERRYDSAIENASASYLFGIREFNDTRKLFFNDLRVTDRNQEPKKYFSIDAKTAIDSNGLEPKSNPRTYKAVKTGVEFEGAIEFYGFAEDENFIETSKAYIMDNLEKFNSGIYRLGNSKSRGYGRISVTFPDWDGGRTE